MLLYDHKFKDRLIIIKLWATELKIPFKFFYSHLEPKAAANCLYRDIIFWTFRGK